MKKILSATAVCALLLLVKCGSNTQPENTKQPEKQLKEIKNDMTNKGIGPIKEVKLT